MNYFQPSFKLAGKVREDARVKKHYHAPATPYQRLLADPRTPDPVRGKVQAVYATLDPVRLLNDIRQAQVRLVEIADQPIAVQMPSRVRRRSRSSLPAYAPPGSPERYDRHHG